MLHAGNAKNTGNRRKIMKKKKSMKIHRQALTEMLNESEEDQTMPGKTGMITAVQKNKETFLLPLKTGNNKNVSEKTKIIN